jgi:peptidoglycan/xylan/chitin deacetylase (PgdA/CDA1 family)
MNRPQQHSGLPLPGGFEPAPALPRAPGLVTAPYKTVSGKLTRFLARNVPIKRLAMRNTRPLVSFTFDDAAASACTAGAALLEQYQARGTYYISGGNCGAASPTGRLATTDQVKALHLKGHEIACHTYSHTRVVDIGRDALARDLERNRVFLQGLLGGFELRNFAYPYGEFSFASKRYLGARFDSCRSPTPGVNSGVADLGALKSCAFERTSIDRGRIADAIAEAVRRNGWLLFAGHDVQDAPSPYGVQPELLVFALTSALEAGCQLVTVAQALQIARGGTAPSQVRCEATAAAVGGHDTRSD